VFVQIFGSIICAQANSQGNLGNDNAGSVGMATGDMAGLPYITFASTINAYSIVEVSARTSRHTCALFSFGDVVCWGSNSVKQIWHSISDDKVGDATGEMAALAPIFAGTTITNKVASICAFSDNTCGILFFSFAIKFKISIY
jgi:alpha-tubulin suppressor-like RCC1 family protein